MKRKEEIQKKTDEIIRKGDFGLLSDYEVTTHVATETAKWADKTMIEKATKWLEENADKYLYNTWGGTGYVPKCSIRLFSDFRKAMEE